MARSAIHPGEHLAVELAATGMSPADLALQLGVPTDLVTEILNGRRAITDETAARLGHFFGTTADMWLNLQDLYERHEAKKPQSPAHSLPEAPAKP